MNTLKITSLLAIISLTACDPSLLLGQQAAEQADVADTAKEKEKKSKESDGAEESTESQELTEFCLPSKVRESVVDNSIGKWVQTENFVEIQCSEEVSRTTSNRVSSAKGVYYIEKKYYKCTTKEKSLEKVSDSYKQWSRIFPVKPIASWMISSDHGLELYMDKDKTFLGMCDSKE